MAHPRTVAPERTEVPWRDAVRVVRTGTAHKASYMNGNRSAGDFAAIT